MGEMTRVAARLAKLLLDRSDPDQAPALGLDSLKDGRGIALGDFDNDGRLDMFVANANSTPLLFRSDLPLDGHHNWVEFLLEGVKSNRDAVGAQVRLTAGGRTRLSFVNGGNGFASQSTHRVHFGLADNQEIEKLEIRWPSGQVQSFEKLAVNRIYRITENQGIKTFK